MISFMGYLSDSQLLVAGLARWPNLFHSPIPTCRLSIRLNHANVNVASAHRPRKHLLRYALAPDRIHKPRHLALAIHGKRVQHPNAAPFTPDGIELRGIFHTCPSL